MTIQDAVARIKGLAELGQEIVSLKAGLGLLELMPDTYGRESLQSLLLRIKTHYDMTKSVLTLDLNRATKHGFETLERILSQQEDMAPIVFKEQDMTLTPYLDDEGDLCLLIDAGVGRRRNNIIEAFNYDTKAILATKLYEAIAIANSVEG